MLEFSDLRERLSTWRAFEAPKLAKNRLVSAGWTLALLGLVARRRAAAATCVGPTLAGVVLLVLVSYSIREALKVQVIDNQSKATAIGSLVFLMLAPFARLALHFVFHVSLSWPS